jgi:hypothetical protein
VTTESDEQAFGDPGREVRARNLQSRLGAGGKPSYDSHDVIHLTPAFKLIFGSVLAITFVSLLVMIALAIFVQGPNDQVKNVFETCSTTFKLGVGAILGLISGKTT